MKAYFKNIQTLLVVVLAALLFFQRGCSSTPPVEPKVITEVVTKWEKKGWTLNKFFVGNNKNPLWHCVGNIQGNRFSIGFKPIHEDRDESKEKKK